MWKIRTFIGSISIKIPTDILENKNRPSFCGPAAIVTLYVSWTASVLPTYL